METKQRTWELTEQEFNQHKAVLWAIIKYKFGLHCAWKSIQEDGEKAYEEFQFFKGRNQRADNHGYAGIERTELGTYNIYGMNLEEDSAVIPALNFIGRWLSRKLGRAISYDIF